MRSRVIFEFYNKQLLQYGNRNDHIAKSEFECYDGKRISMPWEF